MRQLRRITKTVLAPVRGRQKAQQEELLERLLQHAQTHPHHIAIKTTQQTLTYQELLADVLHWLILFKPYTKKRVMVCLERTPRLISVLLALQWLEITYIPIDITLPIERIQAILTDSQAQAFIFDTTLVYSTLTCHCIDLNHVIIPHQIVQPPVLPKNKTIAYIIYTSGSTGKPKGVAISRRALNNFLGAMSQYFLQNESELLLAITTLAFDIAVLELFLPLWQHKAVFIANREEYKDPFMIMQLLADHPITLLQATPGMWNMLESVHWPGKAGLVALCGGEPLTQMLAQRLLPKVASLWNMYGPTEATVWCALKQIHAHGPITIGCPIDNMSMCVLDAQQKILPVYVKGELYIGGIGLAEGYINNPILTQQKFFENILGERMYRVGDIACRTADGEFIIFGRTDNQIKYHGFRIELEDIEAHIQAHPAIHQCAVAVYHEQIIGYLCLQHAATFSEEQLVIDLQQQLPEYMIPKRFVLLNQLPLTINGKINRRALPPPIIHQEIDIANITPLQLNLINIWREEFSLPHIGINDNFFELGGHSLLATRIIARIRHQLGKQLTFSLFYQAPTINQLTELLVDQQNIPTKPRFKPKTKTTQWFQLNDFQLMLWASYLFEPKVKKLNIAARIRIDGKIHKSALDLALKLVIQKHEVLSYRIHPFFPVQKQQNYAPPQWQETSLIEMDIAASEQALLQSFTELNQQAIWPACKVLLVAKIFYLPRNLVEIQVSLSHLIADENSLTIFFYDLSNAYLFYTQHMVLNAKDNLEPFKKYSIETNKIAAQHLSHDTHFWQEYLSDAHLFHFPKQYVIPHMQQQNQTYSSYVEMPENLLMRLQQYCMTHRLTISDLLCAAVALTLATCSDLNQQTAAKLFMSIVKSTRDNAQYDHAIGCFLRLQPIKLACHTQQSLLVLAQQAQLSFIETADYQYAPSLIKLASIRHLPLNHSLKLSLINGLLKIAAKMSVFHLPPQIFQACSILACFQRDNQFLVNINIWQSFFDFKEQQHATFCGYPFATIPHDNPDISIFDNVFDITFLRKQQQAFIVISANLTPSFRQSFGRTFIKILQREMMQPHVTNETTH